MIAHLLVFLLSLLAIQASAAVRDRADLNDIFQSLREQTLLKSPDVRLAESEYAQKRSAVYSAFTRWAPRIDLRLSDTISKDYSFVTSGALGAFGAQFTPEEQRLMRYSLDATFPLFKRDVQLGASLASAELDAALTQTQLKRSEISWNLRQLYGGYLLQVYKLSTIQRSLEVANTNLREAQARFQLGARTIIDVLKAKSAVAELEAQKVTSEADRVAALDKLAEYTGKSAVEIEALGITSLARNEDDLARAIERFINAKALLQSVDELPNDPARLGEVLAQRSAVYKSYYQRQEIERLRASQVTAANWPELDLRGSLSKQSENWKETLGSGDRSYSYGVVLTIPLFSFGSDVSSVRERRELELQSEIRKSRDLQELRDTLGSQRLRIDALAKAMEAYRFALDQNEEIERLSFKSYQLGRATFLELRQAQNDLLQAKIRVAQAQVDLAVLVWQFKANLGVIEQ